MFIKDRCFACKIGYAFTGVYSSNGAGLVCTIDSANCISYSPTSGICTVCASGYYINGNGVTGICTSGNPYCQTFTADGSGLCASCLQGYSFLSGDCFVGPYNGNPYCAKFSGTSCLTCNKGFYINSNGRCTYGSAACKSFANGLG
jgi:hypothetical protein